MNFMKTVQKVKEIKNEEVISGNDKASYESESFYYRTALRRKPFNNL